MENSLNLKTLSQHKKTDKEFNKPEEFKRIWKMILVGFKE